MEEKAERITDESQVTKLRVAPQATLVEQWSKLQAIETELRTRIATARLQLKEDYDKRRSDIEHEHARAMLRATTDLETKRMAALKDLERDTADRMHELLQLAEKIDAT